MRYKKFMNLVICILHKGKEWCIMQLPNIGNSLGQNVECERGKNKMDNLTRIIRSEISKQYRSVRQFAFAVGVPLSTVNSALHNGVGGSSFDTVLQICKALGIKALGDDAAFYLTENTEELLTRYAMLDDYGRHTIDAVMRVEYERCTQQDEPEMGRGSVNI